jgi:hypothetical protein
LLGGIGGVVSTPLPPAAATAVTQACAQLSQTTQPLGVNVSSLQLACSAAVNGQGETLLRTFLASPQLGCIAFAGLPLASDPQVAAACQQFATAIQPYSSLLGGVLP